MVGAQDDQVFDGGSFVLNPRWRDGRVPAEVRRGDQPCRHSSAPTTAGSARNGRFPAHPDAWEQDYRAWLWRCGLLRKTGFGKVVLGLSGGIDSALVATIAADALGADNVRCVMLPSEYTSQASLEDAAAVARALGCRLDSVPIEQPAMLSTARWRRCSECPPA